jgi:hypothetical protein
MNTQNNRENSMKQISRRTVLKGTAAAMAISAFAGPSLAQGIEELVIAYNVNLPSWDPTVGPSAVNPTIQGIYQSVFDQFILQQPDLSPAPRPADRMGLERRQDQDHDDGSRRRDLA